MALVPEGRQIFTPFTVRDNLRLGAIALSGRGSLSERHDYVLDLFPRLAERANQRAGTMSGGEQQMLAIGRALMCKPTLLLLDEPFLGLAPKMVEEIVSRAAKAATRRSHHPAGRAEARYRAAVRQPCLCDAQGHGSCSKAPRASCRSAPTCTISTSSCPRPARSWSKLRSRAYFDRIESPARRHARACRGHPRLCGLATQRRRGWPGQARP